MKRILFALVASIATLTTFAQADQSDMVSATLLHGDQTKVYYTAYAAQNALKDAVDGDVIILSEGQFDRISISKSVAIYGAGLDKTMVSFFSVSEQKGFDEYGKEYYYYPVIKLEGIHFNNSSYNSSIDEGSHNAVMKDFVINKCKLSHIYFSSNMENCRISQSVFLSGVSAYSSSSYKSLIFENCYLEHEALSSINNTGNTVLFDHCIMMSDYTSAPATYTNSIIKRALPKYSTAYNNIFIQPQSLGEYVVGDGNWFGIAPKGIYAAEDETGEYADDKDFALKYPKLYVGTDGTEVGINGGHGFSRIAATPSIVASDIDTRAEEGKIKVNITVEAHTK
ncbi:MAG: hypothetical protein K2H92_00975 [Bacteroidaceae bacterium]|nr:hypothetical protein [Bacteroidaceae bacterium]